MKSSRFDICFGRSLGALLVAMLSMIAAVWGSAASASAASVGVLLSSPTQSNGGCEVGSCGQGNIQPLPFGGSASVPFSFTFDQANGDEYQISGTIGISENSDGTSLSATNIVTATLVSGTGAGGTSAGAPDTIILHMQQSFTSNGIGDSFGIPVRGSFSCGIPSTSSAAASTSLNNVTNNATTPTQGPFSPPGSFSQTTPLSIPGSLDPLFEDTVYTLAFQQGAPSGSFIQIGNTAAPSTAVSSSGGTSRADESPQAASPLVAAVLPASRSVEVGCTATAFATMINSGGTTAPSCSIAPAASLPLTFLYQTTNPATNAVTGTANTPVNIPAGASQSFVIALTPTGTFGPTNLAFNFACTGVAAAPSVVGLNTLLISASNTPVPDIVALGATAQNDGIVHVTGSPSQGAFAVATVNLGAGAAITATANTGGATLPVSITLCQTNPATGQCTSAVGNSVSTTIQANATPTFAIFVSASGSVPFDPANNRITVQFTDAGNVVRGETSVAVETQ